MPKMSVIQSVFVGHQVRTTGIEIEIDAKHIMGVTTSIVRIGPETISILTADSTPQSLNIDPNAEKVFEAAARKLVESGTEFYTVLRPDWALPALNWRRS